MIEEKLDKFVKTAEELANSKEPGFGAFENKWEWFVLRIASEITQTQRQEIREAIEKHAQKVGWDERFFNILSLPELEEK